MNISNSQRYFLQNFLNGNANKTDDVSELYEKTEIKETDIDLINKSIEKYVRDFAYGEISYKNFKDFMFALGASNIEQTTIGNNIKQKFTVNGKTYEVVCNKRAAASSADDEIDENGYYTKRIYETDDSSKKANSTIEKFDDTGKKVISEKYDKNNRLTSYTNYTYNVKGLLLRTEQVKYDEKSKKTETITSYNEEGKKVSETITYYDESGSKISDEVYSFDKDGKQIGCVQSNYDPKTKEKTSSVVSALDENGYLVKQSRYQFNKDRTTSYYVFNGNKEYYAGTFNTDELANQKPVVKVGEKVSVKNSNTYYVDEKNEDGNIVFRKYFDSDGNVTKIYHYFYDEKGRKTSAFSTYYNKDGNLTQDMEYTYDQNGKTESCVLHAYNEDGQRYRDIVYNYDKNGEKTGQTVTNYNPATQKIKYVRFDSYDKETDKYTSQYLYEYNADGTITCSAYINGKVYKYGNFADDEVKNQKAVAKSGRSGRYDIERDADGNKLFVKSFDSEGNLTSISHYLYDANGNIVKVIEASYREDGSKEREVTKLYDANGNQTNKIEIDYDADGNKTKESATNYDANGKRTYENVIRYDADGNKTSESVTNYNADGKRISENRIYYNADGNKTSESVTNYNADGKRISENLIYYNADGNKTKEIVTNFDADGKRISEKVINYDADGNITSERVTNYSADGTQTGGMTSVTDTSTQAIDDTPDVTVTNIEDIDDDSEDTTNNNMYIEIVTWDKWGKETKKTVPYNAKNIAKYKNVRYSETNGEYCIVVYYVKTVENEDGTKTEYRYNSSTGSITTVTYNTNGKEIWKNRGIEQIGEKGKITKSQGSASATMTTRDIYHAITNLDARSNYFFWTNVELMYKVNGFGKFSEILLRMANDQAGYYSGSDAFTIRYNYAKKIGCNKVFDTYNDTAYSEFIKQSLIDALSIYGYDPEWVKGYNFPTNSTLSNAISNGSNIDPDMKNFVKKYIEKIKNGNFPISGAFDCNKDLSYSIHGFEAIDGKISGTTLTLTLFDIYDFDQSYIDKLQNTPESNLGTSDILNAAGAAAMKDGKLTPYYFLIEVKIDLTQIFTAAELNSLGIG